jgi:5-methylcytosine-specific restriction endonuclease McrA
MSWKADRGRFRRRRAALRVLQQGRCYLCNKPLSPHGRRVTDDHVVPKSRGGTRACNILLAHKLCNERKRDRAPYPCELLFAAAIYDRLSE